MDQIDEIREQAHVLRASTLRLLLLLCERALSIPWAARASTGIDYGELILKKILPLIEVRFFVLGVSTGKHEIVERFAF